RRLQLAVAVTFEARSRQRVEGQPTTIADVGARHGEAFGVVVVEVTEVELVAEREVRRHDARAPVGLESADPRDDGRGARGTFLGRACLPGGPRPSAEDRLRRVRCRSRGYGVTGRSGARAG